MKEENQHINEKNDIEERADNAEAKSLYGMEGIDTSEEESLCGTENVNCNENPYRTNGSHTKAKSSSTGSGIFEFFKSLFTDLIIAIIFAMAIMYFIRPTIVKQSSMESTMHSGDYVIMYKQAYKKHEPKRGDIIIFKSSIPGDKPGEYKNLIKRVVGLPGDEISIQNDDLYINGKYYEEDYIKDGITPAHDNPTDGESVIVPEDSYYVMGDNRVVSNDSRGSEVSFVPKEIILGRAVLRLYPFNQIKAF